MSGERVSSADRRAPACALGTLGWSLTPTESMARLALIAVLVSLALTRCAYDLTDSGTAPAGTAECVYRQAVFCACQDGSQGVQTCTEESVFSECDCSVQIGPEGTGAGTDGTAGQGTGDPPEPDWTPTCQSGRHWTQYEDDGKPKSTPLMTPGRNCIGCHTSEGEGPRFSVAGTVFGGLHDEDDCFGVRDAVVHIIASDGAVVDLTTNEAGNFMRERNTIALPYTASVRFEGGERQMVGPQTDLNCANCHTLAGEEGAPGRIIVP